MSVSLPPVTIAIPFFNAEGTLLDSVRAVFAQTHQNWELILIDDGSTDRSLELAKSIKDPRVKVYSDGKNMKLATRLNEVIDIASFDYIARMDADDLMARDRIEKELSILVSDPSCDLVTTGLVSLNDDCMPVGMRCVKPCQTVTSRSLLFSHHGIVHASLIARKEWYKRNRYTTALPCSQDKSLWIKAYSNSDLRIRILGEPLYFYREDSSAMAFKLLQAYRVGRWIVAHEARTGFPISDKMVFFGRSFLQSLLIKFLYKVNRMHLVRKRRVTCSVTMRDIENIKKELEIIQSIELPV